MLILVEYFMVEKKCMLTEVYGQYIIQEENIFVHIFVFRNLERVILISG